MEIMLLAERFDAQQALAWGSSIASCRWPTLEATRDRAIVQVARGRAGARDPQRQAARCANRSGARLSEQLDAEAASFAACAGTPDFAEGIAAFLEKRPPRFGHRDEPRRQDALHHRRLARHRARDRAARRARRRQRRHRGEDHRAASEASRHDLHRGRGDRAAPAATRCPSSATSATRPPCTPRSRAAVARFGGIDILVNNASAISLTGTLDTPMKRFDLMFGVNVRGTFLCSQACLPHLREPPRPGAIRTS